MARPTPVPEHLNWFDYYQILVSVLLIFFGAWILLREVVSGRVVLMAWLLGGSFLLFGLYRMKHVLDYFRKKR